MNGDPRLLLDEVDDLDVVLRRRAHVGVDVLGAGAAGQRQREHQGNDEGTELPGHGSPPLQCVGVRRAPPRPGTARGCRARDPAPRRRRSRAAPA